MATKTQVPMRFYLAHSRQLSHRSPKSPCEDACDLLRHRKRTPAGHRPFTRRQRNLARGEVDRHLRDRVRRGPKAAAPTGGHRHAGPGPKGIGIYTSHTDWGNGVLRGRPAFSSPGVYAWGTRALLIPFRPFRGSRLHRQAPEGAKAQKTRRVPGPRRKRLG